MPPKNLIEILEQTKEQYSSTLSTIQSEHKIINKDLEKLEEPKQTARDQVNQAKLLLKQAESDLEKLETKQEDLLGRKRQVQADLFSEFTPKKQILVDRILKEESAGWCRGIIESTKKQLVCSNCKKTPLDPNKVGKVCVKNHAECSKCRLDHEICNLCWELKSKNKWEEGFSLLNTIDLLSEVVEEVKSNCLIKLKKKIRKLKK